MSSRTRIVLLVLVASAIAFADTPTFDPADDAKHLGPPERFLFWTPEQKVAGFRNIAQVFPTREIRAGGAVYPLPEDLRDLGGLEFEFRGATHTVDDYFAQQMVAGLLVIKDGKVVYERYGLGNSAESRWVSFSVAKSVTSMLVGAAIQDGYIGSVEEKVTDYLPRLKGSSYDQVSIRTLLQMASGVAWDEDYADPDSDVNSVDWSTLGLYEYLRAKPRTSEPGEAFNYNTAETNLVGTVVRSAIGNNLATYLSRKIWRPFGMESDASWMLAEPGGGETGGCCISATLRDYGRIGLFAMSNGRLPDGTQVLPETWIAESTAPSAGDAGYGYLWWLRDDGDYSASGIFGQGIHIDPQENVVIALHSARAAASDRGDWALQFTLFHALIDALGD